MYISLRLNPTKYPIAKFLLIGILILSSPFLSAQPYSSDSTGARTGIHLQLDKSVYGRGETIWFNAYLFGQEGMPFGSSLQVEIIKDDSVWSRALYPIVLGITNGQLLVPKDISSGWYQIRAYTDQVHLPAYRSFVFVIGKELPVPKADREQKDSTLLNFYPESRSLIAGMETLVAIHATDRLGRPINLNGSIIDQSERTVTTFSTWAQGLGDFHFTPEEKNQYHAEWIWEGRKCQRTLPLVQPMGTMLSVVNHPEGFLFEINRKGNESHQTGAWLIGMLNGAQVFKQPLATDRSNIQGVLKTRALSSGVLRIHVLNEKGAMITSRNVFVNNGEYRQSVSLQTDTFSAAMKAKNKWWLQLPDSLQGTMSISVTDADLDGGLFKQPSILPTVLLTSELSKPVHQPDWYFHTSADSAEIGLDLLMLTHTENLSDPDKTWGSERSLNRKGFITLKGKAFLRGTRQPLTQARLMAVLSVNRMRSQILFTETDKNGRFTIDSLLFFGTARIFFSEQRTKKNPRFIDIQLDEDSIPLMDASVRLKNDKIPNVLSAFTYPAGISLKDYEDIIRKSEGLMLEEVTIKTRSKSALQKLQEEYTSGAFDTDAFVERSIDLVNSEEAYPYPNIFEYLRFRVPGLQVVDPDYSRPPPALGSDLSNDPTKYRIFFRQMPSASSMGNVPMIIYLNEIETDPDILLTIPAADIALVRIFSSFTAAPGGGPGGALAIYTKKPELLRQSTGSAVSFKGYSSNASFPFPNYEADPGAKNKYDGRITLDWRPSVFITPGRNRMPISFYNNDRTKRFRVRVEGLTASGTPIYFETILE